jgi:FixJ family two-component response regulator
MKEVAAFMDIEPRQAEWIRTKLGRKFGARSIAELVVSLMQSQLVAVSADAHRQ